jgi:hypothetical protein
MSRARELCALGARLCPPRCPPAAFGDSVARVSVTLRGFPAVDAHPAPPDPRGRGRVGRRGKAPRSGTRPARSERGLDGALLLLGRLLGALGQQVRVVLVEPRLRHVRIGRDRRAGRVDDVDVAVRQAGVGRLGRGGVGLLAQGDVLRFQLGDRAAASVAALSAAAFAAASALACSSLSAGGVVVAVAMITLPVRPCRSRQRRWACWPARWRRRCCRSHTSATGHRSPRHRCGGRGTRCCR